MTLRNPQYSKPGPARRRDPIIRTCMCCPKKFLSEGPHNRLCPDCRGKSDGSSYGTRFIRLRS